MRRSIVGLLIGDRSPDAESVSRAVESGRCPAFPLKFVRVGDVDEALVALEDKRNVELIVAGFSSARGPGPEDIGRLRHRAPAAALVALVDPRDEEAARIATAAGALLCVPRGALDAGGLRRELCSVVQQHRLRRGLASLGGRLRHRTRLDSLKDGMVNEFSHEVRTPLTVIKSAVCCLHESLAKRLDEREAALMDMAVTNCARLLRLTESRLELSRLESGHARPARSLIEPGGLIRESIRAFRLLSPQRHIEILEEFAPGLPRLYADPNLFVEVLENLLSNALRFAVRRVTVRAAAVPGARIRVSVADDGPGVPRHRIRELFRKYTQVGRVQSPDGYHGTGLGLAICKQIVERQDGRIWLECSPQGGTCAFFELPTERPAGKAASHRKKS